MKKFVLILIIIFSEVLSAQVLTHQELAIKLGGSSNILETQILSSSERESLLNYVSYDEPLYEDINGYLRGTTSDYWFFSNTKEIARQVALMDKAIEKLPSLPESLILFRGQTLGYRKNKFFDKNEIITDKAYWSSTTDLKTAESFASDNGVVFVIYSNQRNFKGALLVDEDEVLLLRDIEVKIMSSKIIKNRQYALAQICDKEQGCLDKIENSQALSYWLKFFN